MEMLDFYREYDRSGLRPDRREEVLQETIDLVAKLCLQATIDASKSPARNFGNGLPCVCSRKMAQPLSAA